MSEAARHAGQDHYHPRKQHSEKKSLLSMKAAGLNGNQEQAQRQVGDYDRYACAEQGRGCQDREYSLERNTTPLRFSSAP